MTVISAPKQPTHVVQHVDNWDGEHNVITSLVFIHEGNFFYYESGTPLLQHVGDEVLKVWELKDAHAATGTSVQTVESGVNTTENGTLFCEDDASTYPPEFTFVVTNIQNEPVYYDRAARTWWTAKADKDAVDLYGRNDFYYQSNDVAIYWQPIAFQKAPVLLIPAESGS